MKIPRLKSGLVRHPLDEQVLVYDPQTEAVHLLDQTTGCVFELLQEGGWTAAGIEAELKLRLGVEQTDGLLALALAELRGSGMLVVDPAESLVPTVDRRELLKKVASIGIAAFLIPAIATVTANPAYAGSGAGALGECAACTSSADCAAGRTCQASSLGGARCSDGTPPAATTYRNGGPYTITNVPGNNCSGDAQNSANARCCSGSGSFTNCTEGGSGSNKTVSYTLTCNPTP